MGPSGLGARGYTVLLADMVGSRTLRDRQRLQERLLAHIQADAAPETVAADIVAGDEIKAVFTDAGAAYAYLCRLREAFPGIGFRAGIGHGALMVPATRPVRAGHIDGPAFHQARVALRDAKAGRPMTWWRGFGDATDVIQDHVDLMEAAASHRTKRQQKAWELAKQHESMAAAAKAMGVKPSTFSHLLARSHYDLLRGSPGRLQAFLSKNWRLHP